MTNYEQLKKIIIEAGVDLNKDILRQCPECKSGYSDSFERPITLEDVLRALQGSGGDFFGITDGGRFLTSSVLLKGVWEFGKPLSEQSEETINFLYNLLKK